MQMFVANGTHQNIDFQYRLPDFKNYRRQMIPIGGQIKLSGELDQKQIDIIAQFHIKYGMVRVTELDQFKGYFIPYMYSIDKPIPAEKIVELVVSNREVSKKTGERLRAEAAIAVNAQIEENAGEKLTSFEMEITEKPTKDRDPEISEKITITRSRERGAPQDPSERGPLGIVTDLFKTGQAKRSVF
jgi:hypothetical protein